MVRRWIGFRGDVVWYGMNWMVLSSFRSFRMVPVQCLGVEWHGIGEEIRHGGLGFKHGCS